MAFLRSPDKSSTPNEHSAEDFYGRLDPVDETHVREVVQSLTEALTQKGKKGAILGGGSTFYKPEPERDDVDLVAYTEPENEHGNAMQRLVARFSSMKELIQTAISRSPQIQEAEVEEIEPFEDQEFAGSGIPAHSGSFTFKWGKGKPVEVVVDSSASDAELVNSQQRSNRPYAWLMKKLGR